MLANVYTISNISNINRKSEESEGWVEHKKIQHSLRTCITEFFLEQDPDAEFKTSEERQFTTSDNSSALRK